MDLFVDNSVIMMKLMKLMKMLQFSLFFCKMWTFSVKFSDQVFPDVILPTSTLRRCITIVSPTQIDPIFRVPSPQPHPHSLHTLLPSGSTRFGSRAWSSVLPVLYLRRCYSNGHEDTSRSPRHVPAYTNELGSVHSLLKASIRITSRW